jgi:hypothetical protein
MEKRLENLENKIERVEQKVDTLGQKISDIHSVVTEQRVNTSWNKKLLIILLTASLTGGSVFGIKSLMASANKNSVVIEKVDSSQE